MKHLVNEKTLISTLKQVVVEFLGQVNIDLVVNVDEEEGITEVDFSFESMTHAFSFSWDAGRLVYTNLTEDKLDDHDQIAKAEGFIEPLPANKILTKMQAYGLIP